MDRLDGSRRYPRRPQTRSSAQSGDLEEATDTADMPLEGQQSPAVPKGITLVEVHEEDEFSDHEVTTRAQGPEDEARESNPREHPDSDVTSDDRHASDARARTLLRS